jgi:hypothetical protein
MTGAELFEALAPLLAPMVEEKLERRDFCIFATKIALDVGRFFGVVVRAQPVRAILYNRQFAAHLDAGEKLSEIDHRTLTDGSWSVGIGFGKKQPNKWPGHLIAVADGAFGDFSIQAAERLDHGIVTGTALVGPYTGREHWSAICENTGTVVEYARIEDGSYQSAPDWRSNKDLRRPIVGKLIRLIRP